jgi:hypothetical protein
MFNRLKLSVLEVKPIHHFKIFLPFLDLFNSKQLSAHRRLARGDHGLPQVLLGPAMPNPSTPCRRATSETAVGLARPQGGWPAAVFYPLGRPMSNAYEDAPSKSSGLFVNNCWHIHPIDRSTNSKPEEQVFGRCLRWIPWSRGQC